MCAIKSFLISLGVEFHPSGHRTWSEEAKAHLVAQTLEPGATVKAVAERYGVLANQLSAWRRAAKDGELVLPSGAEDEAVFAPLVICEPEAKPEGGTAQRAAHPDWGCLPGITPRYRGQQDRRDRAGAEGRRVLMPSQGVRILIATKPVDFRNYAGRMIMRSPQRQRLADCGVFSRNHST